MGRGKGRHHVEFNRNRFEVKFRLPLWLPRWLGGGRPKKKKKVVGRLVRGSCGGE